MVVDLVIPEEGETLREAHDKWRRWAETKVSPYKSGHSWYTYAPKLYTAGKIRADNARIFSADSLSVQS